MTALDSLFDRYERLLVFDTETTGLRADLHEIIQLSAVILERRDGRIETAQTYDNLIALPRGKTVPPEITTLTGITTQDLREEGISKTQFAADLEELLAGSPLLIAYNAHFDLSFLFYTLHKYGNPEILQGKDKLDLLTVYRDRRLGPHKLRDAIAAYDLSGVCRNAHQAMADTMAARYVMEAMGQERDDLINYVNLFGYPERFGRPYKTIRSVRYLPQRSGGIPLYRAISPSMGNRI